MAKQPNQRPDDRSDEHRGKNEPRTRTERPSQRDLEGLPRWALVAFAARCARRVQPLYVKDRPDAPDGHMKAIEDAISAAEASACVGWADASTVARVAAHNADNVAVYAAHAYADAAAADAARAAARAARAAAYAARNTDAARAVAAAAAAAARAADGTRLLYYALRRDINLLTDLAKKYHWTDDTPVPPEVCGPLWPQGEPEWWPKPQVGAVGTVAPIDLYFDLSTYTPEEIGDILGELAAFYASVSGGDELIIEECGMLDTAALLVPAGGEGGGA